MITPFLYLNATGQCWSIINRFCSFTEEWDRYGTNALTTKSPA